jgi:hypothetical protein
MMQAANTKYVIKYDYTISEDITVPANCVLEFEGGSISGDYTITGNNTGIEAGQEIIFRGVNISGTWNISNVYVSWFELNESVGADNTPAIINAINLTSDTIYNQLIFPDKVLYITSHVVYTPEEMLYLFKLKSNTDVIMNSTLILNATSTNHYYIFYIETVKNVSISGCGKIIGDIETHIGDSGEFGHGICIKGAKNIKISDISIEKCWGDGMSIDSWWERDYREDPTQHAQSWDDLSHHARYIVINNVKIDTCRRQGISIGGGADIEIKNCYITNIGTLKGVNPKTGIDLEPWRPNDAVRNINIHDNYFDNNVNGDIVLYCEGGNNTGRGFDIVIDRNFTSNNGFIVIRTKHVTGLLVKDSNIHQVTISSLRSAVYDNCKISYFGRIEGDGNTPSVNYDIAVSNCNIVATSQLIELQRFSLGLKIKFDNCRFDLGSYGTIIASSLDSEVSIYNSIINTTEILSIEAIKDFVGNTVYAKSISLGLNQKRDGYYIQENVIYCNTGGNVVAMNIISENTNFGKPVFISDNSIYDLYSSSEYAFVIVPASQSRVDNTTTFYIINNKVYGKGRFGASAFGSAVVKRYKNVVMGHRDPEPYTGEIAYQDNIVQEIYNGSAWVSII